MIKQIKNNLNKIGIDINEDDYQFLNDIKNPMIIGLGGSYAYGTNVPTSDLDIRGVAMNSKEEILLGRDFEQIVNTATDTTIYSFKKICQLLVNCNPNTIEIFGLRPDQYLYVSPIGKEFLAKKNIFLSNRCVGSFMGYANQQLYRLQQKSLVAMSKEDLNKHICRTIASMKSTLEEKYDMTGIDFHMKGEDIVVDLDIKDYPTEDLSSVLGVINKTLQDYRKNSMRNKKAAEHGKIAKHSMHLLRLYMMCEDLLLNGEIITYREKEHDLLMDIRNGKYLGEDSKPNSEFFDIVEEYNNRLDYAKKHSVLPDAPDMDKINSFIMSVNEQIIKS